jgi:hypothetical protein
VAEDRTAAFELTIERNRRMWRTEYERNAKATEWAVLYAYLARVDCDEDFSSPIHAERLVFVQHKFQQLLERDGYEFTRTDPYRMLLVRRFAPQLENTKAE